jgi:hypothetical protein
MKNKDTFSNRRVLGMLAALAIFCTTLAIAQTGGFGQQITLKAQTLQEIFRLEQGEQTKITFQNEKKQDLTFESVVVSHINKGPETGVLRLDLVSGSDSYKLLLNRKQLQGKLRYQINLIQEKGTNHYRFIREENGNFVLEKSGLSKIVTE